MINETLRISYPFGVGLGATYTGHLRLTGMHAVYFLLVINKLFSLSVTTEALRVKKRLKI